MKKVSKRRIGLWLTIGMVLFGKPGPWGNINTSLQSLNQTHTQSRACTINVLRS